MNRPTTNELVHRAWKGPGVIPAFNIPYPEMMAPVVSALREADCVGLIAVARLEWIKFGAESLEAVRREYDRAGDDRLTRLHLDHVPVVDEDGLRVDYLADIERALALGYESVMVDGSRLPLAENIAATREVVELAHGRGAAAEAELGAVMGHEAGPLPPYEELFASGKGFTDCDEAKRFVAETGADWLSVAVGNVHGAISAAAKLTRKVEARIDMERLARLGESANVPLVLHGGSGIRRACLLEGFAEGIAKINIGTTVRQAYLAARDESIDRARRTVHETALKLLTDELRIAGTAGEMLGALRGGRKAARLAGRRRRG